MVEVVVARMPPAALMSSSSNDTVAPRERPPSASVSAPAPAPRRPPARPPPRLGERDEPRFASFLAADAADADPAALGWCSGRTHRAMRSTTSAILK